MQQFELFRQKLAHNLTATIEGDQIIFDDNSTFPLHAPLPILKSGTTEFCFGSMLLAVELAHEQLKGTASVPTYIRRARTLKIEYFPSIQSSDVLEYIKGEREETDHFMSIQRAQQQLVGVGDKNIKTIKKQKISSFTTQDYVQLEQTLAPNHTFAVSNTPFHTADYINVMSGIYNELLTEYAPKGSLPTSSAQKSQADLALLNGTASGTQKQPPEAPIIIVPPGTTTSFVFKNLGDLLQEGVYHKPNESEDAFLVKPKPAPPGLNYEQALYHTKAYSISRPSLLKPGTMATFKVCCDPSLLHAKDWNRVVAVFINGKPYQLDALPQQFKNQQDQVDIAKLFTTYVGVFPYFDTELVPQHVQQWNVKQFKLSSSKKHQHQIAVAEMWKAITDHCQRRRAVNHNLHF